MKAWAYSGAKVICIDSIGFERFLDAGAVYTIDKAYIGTGDFLYLTLVEVPQIWGGWFIDRFRPVSTIDTTAQVAALNRLTIPARKVVA